MHDCIKKYKNIFIYIVCAALSYSCGFLPVDHHSYSNIAPHNTRVRTLVLHYTALDFEKSIQAFSGALVSAHYLVPDPLDPSYRDAGFSDVRIFRLVAEKERAWHAGISFWRGRNNINDSSLGIEIVYTPIEKTDGKRIYPPYNPEQMALVQRLAKDILNRYPDIDPTSVVGHSDIAYLRKSDPGSAFPWKKLADAGVGAWPDLKTTQRYLALFSQQGIPAQPKVIKAFGLYGYDIAAADNPENYRLLIQAFQMHFRPQNTDGILDSETCAILYALNEKYRGTRIDSVIY